LLARCRPSQQPFRSRNAAAAFPNIERVVSPRRLKARASRWQFWFHVGGRNNIRAPMSGPATHGRLGHGLAHLDGVSGFLWSARSRQGLHPGLSVTGPRSWRCPTIAQRTGVNFLLERCLISAVLAGLIIQQHPSRSRRLPRGTPSARHENAEETALAKRLHGARASIAAGEQVETALVRIRAPLPSAARARVDILCGPQGQIPPQTTPTACAADTMGLLLATSRHRSLHRRSGPCLRIQWKRPSCPALRLAAFRERETRYPSLSLTPPGSSFGTKGETERWQLRGDMRVAPTVPSHVRSQVSAFNDPPTGGARLT